MNEANLAAFRARRSAIAETLTAPQLKSTLRYEPETGDFFWLNNGRNRRPGEIAGHQVPGEYRLIRVGGVHYKAHRLAFLYMLGEWPGDRVDHVNGDKSDNRWANLRDASHSGNMVNREYPRGTDLPRGVYRERSGKFQARCNIAGRQVYLGMFETPEQARAAYLLVALIAHGSFLPDALKAEASAIGLGCDEHLRRQLDGFTTGCVGHLARHGVEAIRQRLQHLVRRLVMRREHRDRELD